MKELLESIGNHLEGVIVSAIAGFMAPTLLGAVVERGMRYHSSGIVYLGFLLAALILLLGIPHAVLEGIKEYRLSKKTPAPK